MSQLHWCAPGACDRRAEPFIGWRKVMGPMETAAGVQLQAILPQVVAHEGCQRHDMAASQGNDHNAAQGNSGPQSHSHVEPVPGQYNSQANGHDRIHGS